MKKIFQLISLVLVVLLIQSCSSLNYSKNDQPKISLKKEGAKKPSVLDGFDKKAFPNKPTVIENMIAVVQPELKPENRDKIAKQMSKALEKHKVEPQIMVAIIDTESNFYGNKVSSTGDLSVAQINPDVWNRELVRLKRDPIDMLRIKTDQEYALTRMAEILEILKKRYAKSDSKWYARYHSNTLHHKKGYLKKLEKRLKMLAMTPSLAKKNNT